MSDDWFEDGEFAKRIDRWIENLKRVSCDDPEPPWWNQEEEDVAYTSKTAFALLGVLLGNTLTDGSALGFNLHALLNQTRAIKTVEENTRDEDIEF